MTIKKHFLYKQNLEIFVLNFHHTLTDLINFEYYFKWISII